MHLIFHGILLLLPRISLGAFCWMNRFVFIVDFSIQLSLSKKENYIRQPEISPQRNLTALHKALAHPNLCCGSFTWYRRGFLMATKSVMASLDIKKLLALCLSVNWTVYSVAIIWASACYAQAGGTDTHDPAKNIQQGILFCLFVFQCICVF